MVRILYWNLRDFSNNKIANAGPPPNAPFPYLGPGQGPERLTWMLDTMSSGMNGGAFVPDFIVIVEVERGAANIGPGYPIGGAAATGVNNLLNAINLDPVLGGGGRVWHLVPPLSLGRAGLAEGVAVFYNSTAWHFIGPLARSATYAAPFAAALPVRVVPANRRFGQRVAAEERMQGQWHYTSRKRQRYAPPSTVKFPFRNSRPPWLTYFSNVAGPPTLLRLLTIHTSPASADAATRALRNVDTMMTPFTAAQQIDVIMGDFNVNGVNPATWAAGGSYDYLVGAAAIGNANPVYTAAVQPPVGLGAQYRSFYMTHAPAALGNCVVEDIHGQVGIPPSYGYVTQSLDNIFYRTNIGGVPANANATIINRAVGTPFVAPAGPPVPAPYLGTVAYGANMNTPMATILGNIGHPVNDANSDLQEWDNFGRMHSTSDHLPIVVEI